MNNQVSLKAVLVAGGAGTRLSPFTNYTHKTLLPLFDRPVIDYALATIRKSGIKDITIIANEKIGQIANHIGMGREGEKIHYVIEHAPKGVASAINLARPYVEGSRVLLYFSDNITTWDFHDDCERFRSSASKPGAVLLARQVENPQDFGVCVMGDGDSIIDIVEKPKDPPSDLAIGGIYLFDEEFWPYLDQEFERKQADFSISDITRRYVREGRVSVINVGSDTWVDCGTPENLLNASILARDGGISADH